MTGDRADMGNMGNMAHVSHVTQHRDTVRTVSSGAGCTPASAVSGTAVQWGHGDNDITGDM